MCVRHSISLECISEVSFGIIINPKIIFIITSVQSQQSLCGSNGLTGRG